MEQQAISSSSDIVDRLEDHSNNTGYEGLVQQAENGDLSLSILVSGVHCAACIQKIESKLSLEQDVSSVRLNFSTKRLSVLWFGSKERANDFVKLVEGLGYGVKPYTTDQAKESVENQERLLLMCLGVAGFAMGNIMLLSVGLWTTSTETMGVATRDFMHWISAAIAIPTIIFSGRPFFKSALNVLKSGQTNMDVPISLALLLATGMSLYETINHGEHVYFDSAVMLMFFLLIGRYLDMRARGVAQASAFELLSSLNDFATVVENNATRRVPIRDVREGMYVRVSSGEAFPVDGMISEGKTTVDTALVTGETLPRDAEIGDAVYAGTVNLSAPVTLIVDRAAEDSLLADIVRLMEKATQGQAHYVRLADKAARLYTPIVHSMALIAFIGWWGVGGMSVQGAIMISITVLIITCPCALGLAVPVVQVLASDKLFKSGVLVKSGDALERLAKVDTVLLDKTGTLTLGVPALNGTYDAQKMKVAASIASHSVHPLSKALCNVYDGDLLEVKDVKEVAGRGLSCVIDKKVVKLGSRSWCGDVNAGPSEQPELWLSVEGGAPVRFVFQDELRTDAIHTIKEFIQKRLKIIMLSGDQNSVVQKVSMACGIGEYYGEQTPPQKFEFMENLKSNGACVLMVGDGLNDAPTLAGADVSMAPGTAIDMAQNAADIVFMGDKLFPVYETYKTAVRAQCLVRQNFMLAVLYNIVAVPMALSGMVTPLIAAIAMSGSSLLVIGNSFRLRLKS